MPEDSEPSEGGAEVVELVASAGTAEVGRAARVPEDASQETLDEIRRLLLAEDAMLSVAVFARFYSAAGYPADRRIRFVAAAGVAATFWRPFMKDNQGERLDPDEWRGKVANDPDHAALFDRLKIRRNKVFAHSDTDARVVNVTDMHRHWGGSPRLGIRFTSASMTLEPTTDCLTRSHWR
jgi:hypothetical protein